MIFKKLHFTNGTPDNKVPHSIWYLYIDNVTDLLKYQEYDTKLFVNSMKSLPDSFKKTHIRGSREWALYMQMQCSRDEHISPIKECIKLVSSKYQGMLEILSKGPILVHEKGSYSPLSFIKIWNCEVIETLEKDSLYFPSDKVFSKTELLFLENDEVVPANFLLKVRKLLDWTNDYKCLQQLKLQDPKRILKSIENAKSIAIQSAFTDKVQIDTFLELFNKVNRKTIYIETLYAEDLTSRPLYNKVKELHDIHFIN